MGTRGAGPLAAGGPLLANSNSDGSAVGSASGKSSVSWLEGRLRKDSSGGMQQPTPPTLASAPDNSNLTSMDWNDWITSSSLSDGAEGSVLGPDVDGSARGGTPSGDAPAGSGAAAMRSEASGFFSDPTASGAAGSVGPSVTVRIACYAVAASFDLRQLESRLKEAYGSTVVRKYPDVVHCQLARGREGAPGSDAFFFDSGVVACWGMSQDAEAQLVQDVAVQAAVQPLPPRDRERDVFRCTFAADPAAVTTQVAAPVAPPATAAAASSPSPSTAAEGSPLRDAREGDGSGAATSGSRRFPRRPGDRVPLLPLSPPETTLESLPPAAGPFSVLSFPPQMVDDTVLLHVRHMGDTATLLAVSYGLAQSTKLSAMEQAVESLVSETRGLPEALAEHGEVHLSGKQIGRLIGKVFVLKRAVNLLGNVAETPEFFWYAPDNLQALYSSVTRYVELPGRVEQLNSRFDVLQEMLELLRAQEENRHGTRLELVIIWLIVVEVVLGVFELLELFGVIGPGTGFGG